MSPGPRPFKAVCAQVTKEQTLDLLTRLDAHTRQRHSRTVSEREFPELRALHGELATELRRRGRRFWIAEHEGTLEIQTVC